jgi:hypothetical protein
MLATPLLPLLDAGRAAVCSKQHVSWRCIRRRGRCRFGQVASMDQTEDVLHWTFCSGVRVLLYCIQCIVFLCYLRCCELSFEGGSLRFCVGECQICCDPEK